MNIPARKLKKSAVKNIVRFPPIKANGGVTILLESILESKYCLHLEFDPRVETYFPQPKTITVPGDGEEARYTPDFEVSYVSGERCYVEVKPHKYGKARHYQQLFTRLEASLTNTMMGFKVVDELEIYQQPLLSNYEKLYQYRKRPSLDMRNLYSCADQLRFSMPLSRVIAKLSGQAQLREIYSWLSLGYLQFDIASEPLTMMTEVKIDV